MNPPPASNTAKGPLPEKKHETGGRLTKLADAYWVHFVCGFCYHVPLVLMVLAVLALVRSYWSGGEFGVKYLVYHDDAPKRFFVGVALGAVVLQTLFVGYLLAGERRADEPMPQRGPFWRYAVLICLCVAATAAAVFGAVWLVWLVLWATDSGARIDAPNGGVERVAANGMLAAGIAAVTGVVVALSLIGRLWWRPVKKDVAETPPAPLVEDEATTIEAAVPKPDAPVPTPTPTGWVFGAELFSRGWLVFGLLYLYLGYLGCVWVFGLYENWAARVSAFLAATVVVPAALAWRFPNHARRFAEAVRKNASAPRPEEQVYHWCAVASTLLGMAFLFAASKVDAVRSPAIAVCFLMFTVVSGYGFLRYVVRYRSAVVWVSVVLMAVLGGMNQYKLRLPGLYEQYAAPGADPGNGTAPDGLLDLEDAIRRDREAHEAYFEVVRRAVATDEYRAYKGELSKLLASDPDLSSEAAQEAWGLLDTWRRGIEDKAAGGPEKMAAIRAAFGRTRVLPAKDLRPEVQFSLTNTRSDPARLLNTYALQHHDYDAAGIRKKPLVLVTVSGGGLRAAAWTLFVLQELERRFAAEGIDFPAHVRIVCGASGGMLGASYYVTTLPPADARQAAAANKALPDRRAGDMADEYGAVTGDFLTPLVNRAVFSDLPATFSPLPIVRDRGRVLEEEWSARLPVAPRSWVRKAIDAGEIGANPEDGEPPRGALDVSFADLRDREWKAEIPSLVFSPMMVEDGRRLLMSNLDLWAVASNDGHRLTGGDIGLGDDTLNRNFSHEALELFRMFPHAKGRFRLRTAARVSASFPYFSPAATLPTVPRRRVVDAGYYDNYGVSLAASWLFSTANRKWISQHASKVLVVQIRDGVADEDRQLRKLPADSSSPIVRAAEEMTTPPEGLYNARVGSSSFRNDGMLELLGAFYREVEPTVYKPPAAPLWLPSWMRNAVAAAESVRANDPTALRTGARPLAATPHHQRFFNTALFEFGSNASLSWYLTAKERAKLRLADDPAYTDDERDKVAKTRAAVDETVAEVLRWWKFDPLHPTPATK